MSAVDQIAGVAINAAVNNFAEKKEIVTVAGKTEYRLQTNRLNKKINRANDMAWVYPVGAFVLVFGFLYLNGK